MKNNKKPDGSSYFLKGIPKIPLGVSGMIVGGSKGENSETRVNLNFIIYSNHESKIKSMYFHYFSHTNLEKVE